MEYELKDAIAEIRKSKKRNFVESIDLIVNLKNIDLKKPENKFSKEVKLPHGRGKGMEVCVISETAGIGKQDIEDLQKDKKKMKAFIKKYDFFICEPKLMPLVGKVLGKYFAPKGKMPKLLPPNMDAATAIEETKNSVRIRVRDAPVIQTIIGTETMTNDQLKENVEKVMEEIKKSLPGKSQIKSVFLKKTMGKPIAIKV